MEYHKIINNIVIFWLRVYHGWRSDLIYQDNLSVLLNTLWDVSESDQHAVNHPNISNTPETIIKLIVITRKQNYVLPSFRCFPSFHELVDWTSLHQLDPSRYRRLRLVHELSQCDTFDWLSRNVMQQLYRTFSYGSCTELFQFSK